MGRSSNVKESFTSADALPVKLLQSTEIIGEAKKRIIPYHVQLMPTNRCNMNCAFCSCSKEDRKKELPFERIERLAYFLSAMGTRAVTITGGGEPTLHPDFSRILMLFSTLGIKTGLVTNGKILHEIDEGVLDLLTWCRISNDDARALAPVYADRYRKAVRENDSVDWAFSHVASKFPNIDELERVITFANENGFTHVRVVADLFDTDNVPMDMIEKALRKRGVDLGRTVFQPRAHPERGGDCYIGYLKPVIAADGKIFMCCGAQYAIKGLERKMPDELCMGTIDDLPAAFSDKSHVKKGHQCDRCYYGDYNRVLALLVKDVEHREFV